MRFMEQYTSKMASLDDRLLELSNAASKLQQEKKILETRADSINPKSKNSNKETIRYGSLFIYHLPPSL